MLLVSKRRYLESSEYIDWKDHQVSECAQGLARGLLTDGDIARACFEYVRDEIKHSADYRIDAVTCKASDVLLHKTGYCYAKSHLLAALLRANGIPAGLCYQRLSLTGNGSPYSLHGLNALYLHDVGWYRVDARGNEDGVNAQFAPPKEQLAFAITEPHEADIQGVWSEPINTVVDVLQRYDTYREVDENLPDIEIF